MERKVIKHGQATYIISLPSAWVKKFGINKGDELNVTEQGNRLIISTAKYKQTGSVEVDISGLNRTAILILLRALYKFGYDEIKLNFKNQNTVYFRKDKPVAVISVIHEEVNRLIGMEIIQERPNFCIIKSLSEPSSSEFDSTVRRAFLLLNELSEDVVKAAEANDIVMLNSVEERHNMITKILSFCMRLLNKRGPAEEGKTMTLFSLLMSLDKMLDMYKTAGREIISQRPSLSPIALDVMNDVRLFMEAQYEMYYTFNNASITKACKLSAQIEKKILSNISSLSKKELMTLVGLTGITEMGRIFLEMRFAMEY